MASVNPKTNHRRWKMLARQVLIDRAPWLTVAVEQIQLPNGVIIDDYYTMTTRSWVAVFAVTEDGRVPLVRQYRYGIDRFTLELPAGYLEPGESVEDSARRELREEVGGEAAHLRRIAQFAMAPTRGAMTMHVVLAEGVRIVGDQALESTEEIDVQWFTLPALRDLWLRSAHAEDYAEIAAASHNAAIARGLVTLGAL
ncbi:MAG: NUDIX hydrolase [Anaerolineae bacterium]